MVRVPVVSLNVSGERIKQIFFPRCPRLFYTTGKLATVNNTYTYNFQAAFTLCHDRRPKNAFDRPAAHRCARPPAPAHPVAPRLVRIEPGVSPAHRAPGHHTRPVHRHAHAAGGRWHYPEQTHRTDEQRPEHGGVVAGADGKVRPAGTPAARAGPSGAPAPFAGDGQEEVPGRAR